MNSTKMTREEEDEVRSLLVRHQERIMLDLSGTDLLAVLVKNSVLTQSEEDLLLKPYPPTSGAGSAPSSVGVTKRKLSAVISSGSGGSAGGGTVGGVGDYSSSIAGSSANNSRSASVNGDHAQSDNRSITPSVGGGGSGGGGSGGGGENLSVGVASDYCTKEELHANLNSINDADILRAQCATLIEIIAKSGFEKFKQFCYAIESECPQLIEDLINDRLKCDTTIVNCSANDEKLQKEIDKIEYIDKEKENDRNRRAVSYGGGATTPILTTLPRAAPRRVSLMKDPPPPPPPKPLMLINQQSATASPIPSKYPQSEYNLIQKIDSSNSTLTAPAQYQAQNFYANTGTLAASSAGGNSNYSSLLCHASSASSPLAVRKREKLLHRFSDAATLGRKLKKKKNTNRTCRSMTEAIEMLADPVIEDEFFAGRFVQHPNASPSLKMKLLKYTSRRRSFKAKQRKTVLPTQSTAAVVAGSAATGATRHINTQARYIRAGYVPTALIRNGIIGGGEGPGAQGLYQIDDRVYTTTKMFLRDGYMYPRQAGQSMDPRFPYELHEFPDQTGAAGLQLVATPKVHISGEYLSSGGGAAGGGNDASAANSCASLSRRNARKAAAEINLANQVYWMQKHRGGEASAADGKRSRSNSLGQRGATPDAGYIRNVDDLLQSLGKQAGGGESGRGTPHSTASHRRRKKGDRTTWEYHTVSVTRVPGYGFGIAVSGGRDNPHFANGDPSIAVSDVLKGGPAEDRLQVNDRIISVNGVSLENVEYATAVQVLRDSGNTVTLVVKRRVPLNSQATQHQHSHSMSSVGLATASNSNGNGLPSQTPNMVGPNGGAGQMINMSQPNSLNSSLVANALMPGQPIKITLSKGSKKDDYGIVLGCRLFIKEISTKARDQLAANGYSMQEGDVITRIHNTNCGDTMSLKEAKKIIDGCKERLNLVVLRDITNQAAATAASSQLNNSTHQQQQSNIYASHQAQVSNCSNNLDDPYLGGGASYSSQNLYVQPPTRSSVNGPANGLNDEKSNLTPRGRSRGPIMDGVSLSQLDRPVTPTNGASSRLRSGGIVDEPPRPPPPRGGGGVNTATGNANEDFYSSRRQLYEEDPLARSRQSAEPRFISFQKEGSVGIRLTGGNEAGIFVTAVQPGSPASLQGLTPGDKILKVNDMDMHGVTREEAVLFLLSLQDRIDLIVQYCKEEYDEVVTNQRGDSFHIKTHFHCDNPSKGEMAFKAGDVFRVIDTLHNGVVGSWQVLKIGRGHQEMQRGVIPNKSRAEELATAQFNATKKEMNANESRGNFFRRRRSTHRRSKSLSRENWDDVVFSDSISKFPAYERVVLRHPGFVRPVVLFGPISDLAREKLAKDFQDKYSTPLQDDDKSNTKCRIVRLSNIRDIMDRGKHALLDITPNAVDRLNYAQFYPIVIFLKTDSKHVIKQLRQGVPKSAHKSSKKLLEQCQKLERVWSHIFSTQIVLNDADSWYRNVREAIDLQQSGAVWMSESKPVESLSDDFLFPMTTSRLSYASSPESDLELSPGPSASLSLGNLPQLVKSSSDPSIATNQDNLDRDRDIIGEGLPPPYTIPYEHSVNPPPNRRQTMDTSKYGIYAPGGNMLGGGAADPTSASSNTRPQSLYGINAPDLPPRIDRQSKPGPGELLLQQQQQQQQQQQPASRTNSSGGTLGRSAQERLFGKPIVNDDVQAEYITRNNATDSMDRQQASLERQARMNAAAMGSNSAAAVVVKSNVVIPTSASSSQQQQQQQNGSSYDSVSSYDSYNTAAQLTMQNLGRLGPNAPDDLKSVPNANGGRPLPPVGMASQAPEYARSTHDHRNFVGPNDLNRQSSPGRPQYHDINSARNIDPRNGPPQRPSNLGLEGSPRKPIVETKTDYGKYSRNNSASQADYSKLPKNPHMVIPPPNINGNAANGTPPNGSGGPFKPVPPPKPKNYRPPMQGGPGAAPGGPGAPWENGEPGSPRSPPNGFFYPPTPSHHHYSQQTPGSPHQGSNGNMPPQPTYGTNSNYAQQQPQYAPANNGYNGGSHHYNGGSGTGPYIAPHRGMPPPIGNLPPHTPERHALDLAGSREQRGSAFELYRKPQIGTAGHHHNMSEMEPIYDQRYDEYYAMPPPPPPGHPRSRSAPRQYPNELPPNTQDPNYYTYQQLRHPLPPAQQHQQQQHQPHQQQQQQTQQYYDENCMPPPLPPHKTKKKSMLKSPLTAIKNALIKTTRPLRRMNSLVEPADRKPVKSALKRQHSMLERAMQRPYYPDEYPTYPAGFEERQGYGAAGARGGPMSREQLYREQQQQQQYGKQYNPQDLMNSTYQNLESEDIYGNIGTTVPRVQHYGRQEQQFNGYEQDDMYSNRALIDLERRQAESAAAAVGRNGRKIVRRHSTTTADRGGAMRRPIMPNASGVGYEQGDDVYQSKHGAYMLESQRRAPNSEVMTRRRFYPGAAQELGDLQEPTYQSRREVQREMQRNHLYQSKKEMQERIVQGKKEMEREFSPHSSSQSERSDDKSERSETIYQTRREIKESALRTRTQLRDQIYQTRRDALDSMAEPIYVSSKRGDNSGRPEPIYETKEENILQSRENETDEKKEEKTDVTVVEINQNEETLSRSDLQKSSDTVIENSAAVNQTQVATDNNNALNIDAINGNGDNAEENDDDDDADDSDDVVEQPTAIENQHNRGMLQSSSANQTQDISDDVFDTPNAVSSPLVVVGPPLVPVEPPKPTPLPQTPRSSRAPFHISNILKRTGPPAPPPLQTPPSIIGDSRTSIETHYASQASLQVGPPNATSTPYTSNMSLPMAGPVSNHAANAAAAAGRFPTVPREPTTTRGIFDAQGGTLSDNVWNVSLQIPPGAIPHGVRQEIYFTVSDPRMGEAVGGPPLDMENGETMLSPLVMCGPQGLEFLVPVTLNIPHCAGRTASLGLALKATDSEKNLHTEWDNIDLPSNAAAHTVSVKVDHF